MKFDRYPSRSASRRRMRPHAAWKVRIQIARAVRPSMCSRRSRISPAALFVNVIARISFGFTPCALIRWATRWVSTLVLPEPAPAITSSGPSTCNAASRWASFRSARSSSCGVTVTTRCYRRPPPSPGPDGTARRRPHRPSGRARPHLSAGIGVAGRSGTLEDQGRRQRLSATPRAIRRRRERVAVARRSDQWTPVSTSAPMAGCDDSTTAAARNAAESGRPVRRSAADRPGPGPPHHDLSTLVTSTALQSAERELRVSAGSPSGARGDTSDASDETPTAGVRGTPTSRRARTTTSRRAPGATSKPARPQANSQACAAANQQPGVRGRKPTSKRARRKSKRADVRGVKPTSKPTRRRATGSAGATRAACGFHAAGGDVRTTHALRPAALTVSSSAPTLEGPIAPAAPRAPRRS